MCYPNDVGVRLDRDNFRDGEERSSRIEGDMAKSVSVTGATGPLARHTVIDWVQILSRFSAL